VSFSLLCLHLLGHLLLCFFFFFYLLSLPFFFFLFSLQFFLLLILFPYLRRIPFFLLLPYCQASNVFLVFFIYFIVFLPLGSFAFSAPRVSVFVFSFCLIYVCTHVSFFARYLWVCHTLLNSWGVFPFFRALCFFFYYMRPCVFSGGVVLDSLRSCFFHSVFWVAAVCR